MENKVFVNYSRNFKYNKEGELYQSFFGDFDEDKIDFVINLVECDNENLLESERLSFSNKSILLVYSNSKFKVNKNYLTILNEDQKNNETDTWFEMINEIVSQENVKNHFYKKLDLEDYEQLNIISIMFHDESVDVIYERQKNQVILK